MLKTNMVGTCTKINNPIHLKTVEVSLSSSTGKLLLVLSQITECVFKSYETLFLWAFEKARIRNPKNITGTAAITYETMHGMKKLKKQNILYASKTSFWLSSLGSKMSLTLCNIDIKDFINKCYTSLYCNISYSKKSRNIKIGG